MATGDDENVFDIIIVENSKVSQINSELEFINILFKVIIEIDQIVSIKPSSSISSSLSSTRNIYIYGEKSNRRKAKCYIEALTNPQQTEIIHIDDDLLEKLEKTSYKIELIRRYLVNLKEIKIPTSRLVIKGDSVNVSNLVNHLNSEIINTANVKQFSLMNTNESGSSESSVKPAVSTKQHQQHDNNLNQLDQYVKLFDKEMKRFNKQQEDTNKIKRLAELISLMPDSQRANAIDKVATYSTSKDSGSNKTRGGDLVHSDPESSHSRKYLARKENDHLTAIDSMTLGYSNFISPKPTTATKNISSSRNENSKKKFAKQNLQHQQNSKANRNRSTNVNNINKNRSLSASANPGNEPTRSGKNNNLLSESSDVKNLIHYSNAAENNLKFIVIDGSNVARDHGKAVMNAKIFSSKGIKIVVDFFLKRGHKQIRAFVPRFRRGNSDKDCPTMNPEILDDLESKGFLTYTPSRYVNDKLIIPYDDRFILKTAAFYDAIIVSNDNYRDLWNENIEWKKIVEKNLLQYSFVNDLFLVADDPLGRRGPNLNDFLSKTTTPTTTVFLNNNNSNNNSRQKSDNHHQNQSTSASMTTNNNHSGNHKDNNHNINQFATKNQKNRVDGARLTKRTGKQTEELFLKLKEIFPNQELLIGTLLNDFLNITDIDFFLTQIIDSLN